MDIKKTETPEINGGGGYLDLLKFIFSCLIVYYHFLPSAIAQKPDDMLLPTLQQGTAGCGSTLVMAFYIISGFFFARSIGIGTDRKPPEHFIRKRICRLWPVLAFSLLVNFHGEADFANLFFVNSGTGVLTSSSSNPASWYVCNLFWLSLIYYFWLKDAQKRSGHNAVLLTLVLLSLAFLIRKSSGGTYYLSVSDAMPFLTVGMLLAVSSFSGGILFAQFTGQPVFRCRPLVTAIQFVLTGWFIYKAAFSHEKYSIPVYFILFLLLLYFLVYQQGLFTLRRNKLTVFLGNISYAIYMMQFPTFHYLGKMFSWGWLVQASPLQFLSTGVLACIVTGIATYLLIERTAGRVLDSWWGSALP